MDRLSTVLVLVVLAALSGCTTAPPQTDAAPIPNDGWTVTATRVEPRTNEVHWSGHLQSRPCNPDGSEVCRGLSLVQSGLTVGTSWDEPQLPYRDPQALFWRVNATLEWSTENPLMGELELELTALSCPDCKPRVVGTWTGPSALETGIVDVYLEEGEDGVQLTVRPPPGAAMEASWGETGVDFTVRGHVSGYVPVAAPVVLS